MIKQARQKGQPDSIILSLCTHSFMDIPEHFFLGPDFCKENTSIKFLIILGNWNSLKADNRKYIVYVYEMYYILCLNLQWNYNSFSKGHETGKICSLQWGFVISKFFSVCCTILEWRISFAIYLGLHNNKRFVACISRWQCIPVSNLTRTIIP